VRRDAFGALLGEEDARFVASRPRCGAAPARFVASRPRFGAAPAKFTASHRENRHSRRRRAGRSTVAPTTRRDRDTDPPSGAAHAPSTLSPLVSARCGRWHARLRKWQRERPGGAHDTKEQAAMSAQTTTGYVPTRIANLSDVHMLDDARTDRVRARGYDLSTHFVSIGRRLDPVERRHKFKEALHLARHSGATHFVVSGDLTEMGTKAQYEVLAETLHESGIAPWKVTLVPGNHDAYTSPTAWREALDGPLRPWAPTSARRPGALVDVGDVVFLPVDVACHQPVTRSAGEIDEAAVAALEHRAADNAFRHKPIVVVQHHPPFERRPFMQWIDGLRGWARVMDFLERFPTVHVLHGHLHHAVSRLVGGATRILGAPAIVDDPSDRPRVRLYDVRGDRLEAAGTA
jgi:Icc-related predicted phosphoesterase